MVRTAVFGSGSWGTAIAYVLATAGHDTALIGRHSDEIELMSRRRENVHYLPGVFLPESIYPTTDLTKLDADVVFICVPSHAIRESARLIKPYLRSDCIIVNTAKGLEEGTHLRLSEVLKQELPAIPIAVLSGPSHAEEVGRGMPTAVVVTAKDKQIAEYVQDLIMTPMFRVYVNMDMVGVELGGALKNIIALCSGAAEGMNTRDNAKAALMTRGLAEITRLGVALGADPLTFSGLSGLGDLIVTCTSKHSRNLRAGRALGIGKPLDQVLKEVGMVVEGVRTTKSAYELSKEIGISMPITEQAYKVLFEGANPDRAIANLMMRGKKHEYEPLVSF